jgi:hypothetical protein
MLILFAPFINMIATVVGWIGALINALANLVTTLVGGGSAGEKTMTEVSDKAGAVAGSLDGVTASAKAAAGALAAFDELDVLKQDQGTGVGGTIPIIPTIPVPSAAKLGGVAKIISSFINDIKIAIAILKPYWDWLVANVFNPVGDWVNGKVSIILDNINKALINLGVWMHNNQSTVITFAIIVAGLAIAFSLLALWVGLFVAGLITLSVAILIVNIALNPLNLILLAIIVTIALMIVNWNKLHDSFTKLVADMRQIWDGFFKFWKDLLKGDFKAAFIDWVNVIKGIFLSLWDGLAAIGSTEATIIMGIINGIVAAIQLAIQTLAILMGIHVPSLPAVHPSSGSSNHNDDVIAAVVTVMPAVASTLPIVHSATQIGVRQYAQGGVFAPNSAFLGILGDQTKGKNVEAPEELIRKIVREEGGKQAVTVNFTGTMAELVRVMKPHIDKETVRVGSSLITSGVVA